jgi:threonine dehydratase
VGHRIEVWVKHENQAPTNSFKVRNACSALTRLTADERRRGVVAATRGNHGLGLAFGGAALGIPVTVCVPRGNNPEKNEGMRGYGATLVEDGADYDESARVAHRLAEERGMRVVHSTNDRDVIAGAGTLTLEILEERPDLDAIVVAVGGGSQAVGAMTVARVLKPSLPVYAVQAARARAAHDSFHAGRPVEGASADTFADGLATRSVYAMTFEALRQGLSGFVTVEESEIAYALRLLLRTTHNLAEGAGATGLAGLLRLRETLSGKKVAVIVSGGNIDAATLRRVLQGEL